MSVTYDPDKRDKTLLERGLDFDDAPKVFAGRTFQMEDDRRDYGETRWITVGLLNDTPVVIVWTPRGEARRIISMRKCHAEEYEKFARRLGGSG